MKAPKCKCGKPLKLGWTQTYPNSPESRPRLRFAAIYMDQERFLLKTRERASTYTEHDIRSEDGTLVWRGRCTSK